MDRAGAGAAADRVHERRAAATPSHCSSRPSASPSLLAHEDARGGRAPAQAPRDLEARRVVATQRVPDADDHDAAAPERVSHRDRRRA